MPASDWMQRWTSGLAIVSMLGCGGSTMAPSASVLNLAGTWSGTLFQPGSGTGGAPMRITWVASQAGSILTGPHTLVHPSSNAILTGTLTGSVAGSQLLLTESVPQGHVPEFPNCAFTGTGSMTATQTAISGILTTTFSSCEGFNMFADGSVPAQLAVTKQ